MTTPSHTCHCQGCRVEVPEGFNEKGLCLEHYLHDATRKLEAATDNFRRGRDVDNETFHWLLAQLDFVLETIGDESSSLGADNRSKLLELLLGIANLNEFVRHRAATSQQIQ